MSYTITKTDGTTLGTILDGTIDNSHTSLILVGRNYSNYGQIMANNLISLVENFAYGVPPVNPLEGQLWWDTSSSRITVYNGTDWKGVGGATSSSTGPVNAVAGDLWWDSANRQLYVYNGGSPYSVTEWILVGPSYNANNGKSGAIWETINDTLLIPRSVVSIYLDGVRTAIISNNSTFTPAVTINGFSEIKQGYNISSGYTVWGTANNASYLGNYPASGYFTNNQNNSGTGTLAIVNDSGITIGAGSDLSLSINNIHAQLVNNSNNGDISIYAKTNNISTRYLYINGTTGAVEVLTDPVTDLGITTKRYVDNMFVDASLSGVSRAITAPAGTANTMIATTEFVISNSGFLSNKIYQGNSYLEVLDSGTGTVNFVVDTTSVLTATSTGVNLTNGATAATQPQVYNSVGDGKIATTKYVRASNQWWGGSAKFVSTEAPVAGTNDAGSHDGDFWFQYTS